MMVIVPPPPLKYSHTIGLLALTGRGFSNPMHAACTPDGIMYVVNRSNSTQALQGAVRITICNVAGEYLGEFGKYGMGDGEFVWPTAIYVEIRGIVHLAYAQPHDLDVREGPYISSRKCGGSEQMKRPSGL